MKKLLTLLFALLAVTAANAQIVKGDMNGDGKITMADANDVANTYLGKKALEYINGAGDAYSVNNSLIEGVWYKAKNDSICFNADGTTDYIYGCKYEFLPYQGTILFVDKEDKVQSYLKVWRIKDEQLVVGNSDMTTYTRSFSEHKVTNIQLSKDSLFLTPGTQEQVVATVLPANADNSSVTWTSSNTSVATVQDGVIYALAEGAITIFCTANDGSGVVVECTVLVSKAPDTHEAVDLGLSVKWATCNVGASKPEDYGDYFAWGETKGYGQATSDGHLFDWENYKWCNDSSSTMTKYCTDSSYGTVDNKTVLDKEDDAASVNWGGTWRMPTIEELEELCKRCTWMRTSMNGHTGYKVTGPNGNSIFLPAAGCRFGTDSGGVGSGGGYWSSTLSSSYSYYARYLDFNSGYHGTLSYYRSFGQSVRPVIE